MMRREAERQRSEFQLCGRKQVRVEVHGYCLEWWKLVEKLWKDRIFPVVESFWFWKAGVKGRRIAGCEVGVAV